MSAAESEASAIEFLNSETTESEEISGVVTSAPEIESETPPEGKEKPPVDAEKTPEALRAEAEVARKEASDRLAKVDSQIQAHRRAVKAFEERQARVIEREKQMDALVSVSDIAQHLAKKRNVAIDEIWKEWGEEFQNGGKPSEATLAKRERDELRREKEERETAEKRAAEERQGSEVNAWGEAMDGILEAETFKASYPKLGSLPKKIMVDALLNNLEMYRRETGKLPDQANLLKWMEDQIPEPPTPVAAETPPKKKVIVLSSRDANAPANARNLSESEREELAIQFANSLG